MKLKAIWAALDICLPGYRVVETDHHYRIYPPDGDSPPCWRFPRKKGAGKGNRRIQMGNTRKMARFLGVLDCVKGQIKGL